MKSLETAIIINASTTEVWNTLMNFVAYPEWNPFIISIKGQAKEGEKLENTISLKKGNTQTFNPTILKISPQQEFRWLGHLYIKGLFDGEHYFRLEAISPDQTKFIHGEKFSGILSGLIMSMIKADTQAGFERMNEALKQRVETKVLY